jgi:hypothetical protein
MSANLKSLPNKVIILAGARNAGKTQTLGGEPNKGFKGRLVRTKGRIFFSLNGKGICIYTSSCQEQNPFCNFQRVIKCIDDKINRCDSEGCTLLIIPFTMCLNRQGKLNTDCIVKPIDHLKAKGLEVHLVYLRKDSAEGIDLMDDLMSRLHSEKIKSDKDYKRQVDDFWDIFLKVDP